MTERGQRTTIKFGGVRAEVSLVKTSGKPKAAQHETKRVLVERPLANDPRAAVTIPAGVPVGVATAPPEPRELTDPETGETTVADVVEVQVSGTRPAVVPMGVHEAEGTAPDPLGDEPEPVEAPGGVIPDGPPVLDRGLFTETAPQAEYVPPATDVQQGVHLEDGTWVDLTEHLREVDERTRVDGMEVVATIASASITRERVRESYYVAGVNPDEYDVLALLWRGLRQTNRAAAVRFTKRTAQALGIIVARGEHGSKTDPATLILLELEWAQNMRPPGPRAVGPIKREVADDEVAAAVELVEAFAAGPSALNDLRDERLAKRAELLALARAGSLQEYAPPPEPMAPVEAESLAEAFALSAAALR